MKSNRIIKICGVRDSEELNIIAHYDVNWIGILAPNGLEDLYKTKIQTAEFGRSRYPHLKLVCVTKCREISQLMEITKFGLFDIIQLHSPPNVGILRKLISSETIEILPVISLDSYLSINSEDIRMYCSNVLFDFSYHGGLGIRASDIEINDALEWWGDADTFILAGGLNHKNVADLIAKFQPGGLDLYTGTRDRNGILDKKKLVAFVNAVRNSDGFTQNIRTIN